MAMMSDLMRGSPRGEARADADLPRLDEALDDMYRSAQSLTRAVDEIVWAVNPANDTLPRLFTFLAHDAEDMARGGGLELQIHADDDLPDIMLPASTRHHLCMLVREAVANVLKHARAGVLDVSLRYHAGTVDVVIADDGVGFDHAMPARDGHDGLANMQARMDELGGTLSIDSAPGRGTRVAVHVPLKAPAPLPSAKPRLRLRTADDPDHDARRTG
jgi:signal transduction histidine kinase